MSNVRVSPRIHPDSLTRVSNVEEAPPCPRCAAPLKYGGLLLSRREEDDARVCQVPWLCHACKTAYVRWADRPADLLREDADIYRLLAKLK